jgi:hypothetical protein
MEKDKNTPSLFRGVMLAYFILILHVLLIAILGVMVIFFRGIVHYMAWIFLVGAIVIAASAYYFYKRIKSQGKTVKDLLSSPLLSGKSVEVSLLGGMASVKIGRSSAPPPAAIESLQQVPKLEDTNEVRIRELTELAKKLENDLISPDEYNKAQKKIFKT